jgi:hypothetical protein
MVRGTLASNRRPHHPLPPPLPHGARRGGRSVTGAKAWRSPLHAMGARVREVPNEKTGFLFSLSEKSEVGAYKDTSRSDANLPPNLCFLADHPRRRIGEGLPNPPARCVLRQTREQLSLAPR